MREVFISYSRKDLEEVKKIKYEIYKNVGTDCWMDLNGIESGSPQFTKDIVDGINDCKVFLFMLSQHSQESQFALSELSYAYKKKDSHGKHVVIVNINDCRLTDEFKFRYGLTDIISWYNEPQRNKLIKNLKLWTQNSPLIEITTEAGGLMEEYLGKSKKIRKVFIAGSKSLNKERDALRVVFSQITNRGNTIFQTWTYEDFPRKIVKGGQQNLYNSFIEEEAESVIFILENNVGGITKKEFDVAINSFRSKGHPQIYVFHHESEMLNKDIEEIKAILPDYYADYQDLNELKLKIWQEFGTQV